MAQCQYCTARPEIGWHQVQGKQVAFHALRGTDGQVVRKQERNGKRIVFRVAADVTRRHYPPVNLNARTPDECPDWTPAKAAEHFRQRGKRRGQAPYTPAPEAPQPHPEEAPQPFEPIQPQQAPPDVRSQVRAEMIAILDEYGVQPPAQEIVVKVDGTERPIAGQTHAQVPQLVRLLARGLHVYLYGGAGGGKTHAAVQALEATVGRATMITMPGITVGKLFGFTDAVGRYVHTAFVDAYTNGGGIVMDEFDRTLPQVASALNSVLENRRATFNGAEVPMHANFRLVATGNTDMRGANRTYTGAQPQDLATAARFRFVVWGYDETLETALVSEIVGKAPAAALLQWGRRLRAQIAQDRHDTVFCGPREMMRVAADLAAGESIEDAVQGWIFRGLTPETVARMLGVCPLPTIPQVRQ